MMPIALRLALPCLLVLQVWCEERGQPSLPLLSRKHPGNNGARRLQQIAKEVMKGQPGAISPATLHAWEVAGRSYGGGGYHFQAPPVQISPLSPRTMFSMLRPDPELLRWDENYSPDHLPSAGEAIGGWLSVPLIHDPYLRAALKDVGDASPRLCLRIKARPAAVQPAVNGPLLFHCGGPGSGRDCVAMSYADNRFLQSFDSFGIDQRGISLFNGDSYADNRAVPACPFAEEGSAVMPPLFSCHDLPEANKVISMLKFAPPEAELATLVLQGEFDIYNRSLVDMYFRIQRLHASLCFNAERFKIKGPANSSQEYNFFDYVSTSDLTHDLDLYRQAVGSKELSIHGFSYGTMVSSLYATLFPSRAKRIIANGVVSPHAMKSSFAAGAASAYETVWSGMALDCDSTSFALNPDESRLCPAAPRSTDKFKRNAQEEFAQGFPGASVQDVAGIVIQKPDAYAAIFMRCLGSVNETMNGTACKQLLAMIIQDSAAPFNTMWDPEDKLGFTPQAAILASDLEGVWSPELYIQEYDEQKSKFAIGLNQWIGWSTILFSWPVTARPTPPLGSSDTPILVIGNLFDGMTGYNWAQQMRQNFPKSSLLTWQGYGHCFGVHDPATITDAMSGLRKGQYTQEVAKVLCQRLVFDYLLTGELPRDGHTCKTASPLPVGPERATKVLKDAFDRCELDDSAVGLLGGNCSMFL